jgi:hypothetical protein
MSCPTTLFIRSAGAVRSKDASRSGDKAPSMRTAAEVDSRQPNFERHHTQVDIAVKRRQFGRCVRARSRSTWTRPRLGPPKLR